MHVASRIAEDVPTGLPADINVIYFPQIGFLISMPKDEETGTSLWEGSEADPWERMFSSDLVAYYKNSVMREMDETIGDIHTEICGNARSN